ncbi:MAG: hypothetical protein AABW59_04140 [archaeon]
MIATLSKKDALAYAQKIDLPESTVSLLANGGLAFERIGECAKGNLSMTAKRILALDCYKDDFNVQLETPECIDYLISKDGLVGDGFFLMHNGADIGYCLVYPVKNERRKDLPADYSEVRRRANWGDISRYLSSALDAEGLGENNLYHHYDYAIKPLHMRGCGFGRLVLRYTLDLCLPKNCLSVGFVDYERHSASLTSASKAGCLMGQNVFPSPDGFHPSFLELYSKKMDITFLGEEIAYAHKKDSFDLLPKAIHAVVDAEPKKKLVGFNHALKRFEIVKASLR